jgi:hypothetical protein
MVYSLLTSNFRVNKFIHNRSTTIVRYFICLGLTQLNIAGTLQVEVVTVNEDLSNKVKARVFAVIDDELPFNGTKLM